MNKRIREMLSEIAVELKGIEFETEWLVDSDGNEYGQPDIEGGIKRLLISFGDIIEKHVEASLKDKAR